MTTEQNGHRGHAVPLAPARRRTPWPLALVAALFVVVPFAFWYGTWFGRPLTDADIERYLKDEENPRHEQHALSQIVERMARGDEGARRWYPQIVALAGSRHADVRMTAAWAMGKDARAAEFHAALAKLITDDEPIVRRNAALALVAFDDPRSRDELRAMLRPYTFAAPLDGRLVSVLSVGTTVKRETMLARVRNEQDQVAEIRAPLAGRIAEVRAAAGAQLKKGEPLVVIAPDEDSVVGALVGLRYVGTREDLPEVERYAQGGDDITGEIKSQAAQTAEAIKRRQ